MSMAHPPAIAELSCLRDVPRRGEPALEVGEDVVDVLDADRKPHIAGGHAGRELFCSALSWEWVVLAGWMARLRASPILATW